MNLITDTKSPIYSKWVMLIVIILGVVFISGLVKNNNFIGKADAAGYSMLAENIVNGEGYKLDFVATPETDTRSNFVYSGASLLQPLVIAASFLFLGVSTFAAKLPNIIILGVFCWVIYICTGRVFDRRVGFLASVLTLSTFIFASLTVYPWADILYYLLIFLFVYMFSRAIGEIKQDKYKKLIIAGFLIGIAILQKPSAISLLPFSFLLLAIIAFLRRRTLSWIFFIKQLVFFYVPAIIAGSPFFIRSKLLFGQFIPSEYCSAAIIKFRFGSVPFSYDSVWQYEGIPSLKTVIVNLGIVHVIKDCLMQVFYGIRSLFLWQDVIPFYILVLLIGYLLVFSLRKSGKKEVYFLSVFGFIFALSFFMYTVYSGYEFRHMIIFIPFFIIFASAFFYMILDYVKNAGSAFEKWVKTSLVLAVLMLFAGAQMKISKEKMDLYNSDPASRSIMEASKWLKPKISTDDVLMTYGMTEFAFHAGGKVVRMPNLENAELLEIADKYGTKYIVMDLLTKTGRPHFYELCNTDTERFEKVFTGSDSEIFSMRK